MNEALWFACGNPQAMVDELRHKVSDRKLRWFSVACVPGPTRINFACFSGVFETEARVNRSQNKVRFADSLGNQAN